MFQDRMKTTAIPERVYALCMAVKGRAIKEENLKEMLEPADLGGNTKYFGSVRDAALQLGLISIKENEISLAIDSNKIKSMDDMRMRIIENIGLISDGLFYKVTREYFGLDDKVFSYKSVSSGPIVDYMSDKLGISVFEDDMRAWRFWASYLGFGYLHDMFVIPNLYQYLNALIKVAPLEREKEYTITEFLEIIKPYANFVISNMDSSKKLGLALSGGLRLLNDRGEINLSHKLDSKDVWFLYEDDLHSIKSTVTHVTVRR